MTLARTPSSDSFGYVHLLRPSFMQYVGLLVSGPEIVIVVINRFLKTLNLKKVVTNSNCCDLDRI